MCNNWTVLTTKSVPTLAILYVLKSSFGVANSTVKLVLRSTVGGRQYLTMAGVALQLWD